jgi:hypothetical protein
MRVRLTISALFSAFHDAAASREAWPDALKAADETGSVHSTQDQAAAHALAIALELAQDDSWQESSVLVTDARGRPIARVRIGQ